GSHEGWSCGVPAMFPGPIRMCSHEYHHDQRSGIRNGREKPDRDRTNARETANHGWQPESNSIAGAVHTEIHQHHQPDVETCKNVPQSVFISAFGMRVFAAQPADEPSAPQYREPISLLGGIGETEENSHPQKDCRNPF